ncbi:hypothetical protein KFY46_26665, partial [Salmonella enterica subsp. enterica serovar 1,4,[5],12:i:-]|nr:hypothetical protein [Salmonella enterica subsp. enterica serovar 1,4,[5],12:i:-]
LFKNTTKKYQYSKLLLFHKLFELEKKKKTISFRITTVFIRRRETLRFEIFGPFAEDKRCASTSVKLAT